MDCIGAPHELVDVEQHEGDPGPESCSQAGDDVGGSEDDPSPGKRLHLVAGTALDKLQRDC